MFAWELGAGLGHLNRLAAVARLLAADGHEVHAVLPGVAAGQAVFAGCAAGVHRAPMLRGNAGTGYADSYAEVLLRCGWTDPAQLGTVLRAWDHGLRRLAPDLLVADFAPNAMLAARAAGIPVIALGTGFTVPPACTPMPFTRAWDTPRPGRLEALEAEAVAGANTALAGLGGAPLPSLAALFDAQARFLCSFPELDHYAQRGPAPWHGPIYARRDGIEPDWPDLPGPRVFAYVHAGHPHFTTLLQALATRRLPTVMYAAGLTPAQVQGVADPDILRFVRFHGAPLRLDAALAGCDIVACHGVATVSAALAAGKPVLHLPGHLEQDMVLYRVSQQGLGTGTLSGTAAAWVGAALTSLLDDAAYGVRAAAFARRHQGAMPDRSAAEAAACARSRLG